MTSLEECFLAFLGGAAYEAACVAWVHFSERGEAGKTAAAAMLCAAAQVIGIGESVHTLIAAPFFIIGYGVGTWGAVRYKQRS